MHDIVVDTEYFPGNEALQEGLFPLFGRSPFSQCMSRVAENPRPDNQKLAMNVPPPSLSQQSHKSRHALRCLKSGTMHGRNKTRGLVERSPAMLSVIFFRQDFVADLPLRPWICSRIGGRVVIVSGVDAGAAILCGSASLASGYRGECFVCGLHTTGIHEGSHAASCLKFVTHELIASI